MLLHGNELHLAYHQKGGRGESGHCLPGRQNQAQGTQACSPVAAAGPTWGKMTANDV